MKKLGMILGGALLLAAPANAAKCVDDGYTLIGSSDAAELPFGYENQNCESCLRNGIYYWKCEAGEATAETEDETAAEQADGQGLIGEGNSTEGQKVNCMDYLRANDVDGFAKCAGLPGKWERNGNTLKRVD